MCRIFSFRSIIQSSIHNSLIVAKNALVDQSKKHPDGWGIAYYKLGRPYIVKNCESAFNDKKFNEVSQHLSSETFLAHIRRATQGEHSNVNTHPFKHLNWTFCHNGHIANFPEVKKDIMSKISPSLLSNIKGSTDSEVLFYWILESMKNNFDLASKNISMADLSESVKTSISYLINRYGNIGNENDFNKDYLNYYSFVLSNGEVILSFCLGNSLYYSTHKHKCPESDSCPFYAKECVEKSVEGYVKHMLISSEPIGGENIWVKMKKGDITGIDHNFKVFFDSIDF